MTAPLAVSISLVVIVGPAPQSLRAPPRGSEVEIHPASAARAPSAPRAEDHDQHRPRFSRKNRVVASSKLAPGVRLVRVKRQRPPQEIVVTLVAPRARIRAVHIQAGPDRAPFHTVSSAVTRTGALAGINGMATSSNGQPMLVREGRIVPPKGGLQVRHPRTGVGLTQDGWALFVTVDGRRASAVGMTVRGFAEFMRALGAVWAVNLDGGASTTTVVRGKVANSPSDPFGERLVPYAVVLLKSGRPTMLDLMVQLHALDERVVPAGSAFWRSEEDGYGSRRPA